MVGSTKWPGLSIRWREEVGGGERKKEEEGGEGGKEEEKGEGG